jgi:hypothetical protein
LSLDKLDTQWLKQTRGDPLPGQLRFGALLISGGCFQLQQPADQPHVAVPSGNDGAIAVRVKIQPGKPHLREPRILYRVCQHIDRKRPFILAENRFGC